MGSRVNELLDFTDHGTIIYIEREIAKHSKTDCIIDGLVIYKNIECCFS